LNWGAEHDGHENDGPSKLQGMKLQNIKLTDQLARHDIAGHKNCNALIEDQMIHVTSLRVELSEQVTTPTIINIQR